MNTDKHRCKNPGAVRSITLTHICVYRRLSVAKKDYSQELEIAFTHLNRLCACKMLDAKDLVEG